MSYLRDSHLNLLLLTCAQKESTSHLTWLPSSAKQTALKKTEAQTRAGPVEVRTGSVWCECQAFWNGNGGSTARAVLDREQTAESTL